MSTSLVDDVSGTSIASNSLIFVQEPCQLFWHEILVPLQGAQQSSTYLPAFQSFMENLLQQAWVVDLTIIFDPCFFSGEFLHSLFSIESGMVLTHLPPSKTPLCTFQIYWLISSLCNHNLQSLFLLVAGLTLANTKYIGILTYFLFAMLDLLSDTFEDQKLQASIFGNV
jgi:hypothetical protein